MNFYLSVADEQLRQASDGPTIGLILCKSLQKSQQASFQLPLVCRRAQCQEVELIGILQ
nr:hypothetical protein [Cupriavidus sp. P-10]